MANPAFMEGVHAAKKNKKVTDNPYRWGILIDADKADLWELGFLFQLEVMCGPVALFA